MVDADTADKHDLKLGDELRDHRRHRRRHARRSSGIATFKSTNPGAAHRLPRHRRPPSAKLLGATGAYTSVDVTAAAGVTRRRSSRRTSARRSAAAVQGADRRRRPPTRTSKDVGGFLDVMKYAMLGFAGIAVLVGIFLIINTFSMLVAQRTREIGLMRAIGSSRRQVNRSVLVEALLLGVVGSVLGVGARRRPRRRPDEAHGHAGMNLSTDDLTVKADHPGRRPGPRRRRHRPRRLPPRPPRRQGLPDGRPARRRHPGRRQGRAGTRP